MKRTTYLFALWIALLFTACDKSDFEFQNDYERSYGAWLNFRESSNNSYRYVVSGVTWAGSSWQTILTVENGAVTGRDFRYNVFNDIRIPDGGWTLQSAQEIIDSLSSQGNTYLPTVEEVYGGLVWTETGDEVGSSEGTAAASPRTLDEVYELAKNQLLVKRSSAKTYFEAKNNGMISTCGFVEDNCMDDCFNGISISSIEAL